MEFVIRAWGRLMKLQPARTILNSNDYIIYSSGHKYEIRFSAETEEGASTLGERVFNADDQIERLDVVKPVLTQLRNIPADDNP